MLRQLAVPKLDQYEPPVVVMKEVGAFEPKTRLGQLLDLVEAGGEVVITRRGKAVARMVPPGMAFDRGAADGPRRASARCARA